MDFTLNETANGRHKRLVLKFGNINPSVLPCVCDLLVDMHRAQCIVRDVCVCVPRRLSRVLPTTFYTSITIIIVWLRGCVCVCVSTFNMHVCTQSKCIHSSAYVCVLLLWLHLHAIKLHYLLSLFGIRSIISSINFVSFNFKAIINAVEYS